MNKNVLRGIFIFVDNTLSEVSMAIVAMLGFDNLVAQSVDISASSLFPGEFPNLMKSPVSGKNISLLQTTPNTLFGLVGYVSHPDPDGVACNYVGLYATSRPSSNASTQQYLMGPPINDTTLDKTGKWYFGASVYSATYYTANTSYAVIGDMDDRTKNIGVLGYATGATTGITTVPGAAGYALYLEYEIDWVAKTVKAWVDGVLVASTTFTTTPIAMIGNPATTQFYPPNMSSQFVPYNYIFDASYAIGLAHVYFVIDKAGDTNPTGRLGPVRVKDVLVSSVDSVGDMAPVGATTNLIAANTATNLNGLPTVSILLDSGKGKGKFHFAKPVLTDSEETISAFQMELVTFKQRDAAANPVFSFSDGTTTSQDYSVTATETPRRDFVTLNAPYAGGQWTPDTIANYLVTVNSVPNS